MSIFQSTTIADPIFEPSLVADPLGLAVAEDELNWLTEPELARLAKLLVCAPDPNDMFRQAQQALAGVNIGSIDDVVTAMQNAGTPFLLRPMRKRQPRPGLIRAKFGEFLRAVTYAAARLRAAQQPPTYDLEYPELSGIFNQPLLHGRAVGLFSTISEATSPEITPASFVVAQRQNIRLLEAVLRASKDLHLPPKQQKRLDAWLRAAKLTVASAELPRPAVDAATLEVFLGVTRALEIVGARGKAYRGVAYILTGRVLEIAGLTSRRMHPKSGYGDRQRCSAVRKSLERTRRRWQ